MMDEKAKNILKIVALASAGYAAYQLLKGKSVKEAVEAPIKVAVDAAQMVTDTADKAVKTVKKKYASFVKGSEEAKKHMAKLRAMRKMSASEAGRKGGKKNKTNRMTLKEYKKQFKKVTMRLS